MHVPRITANTSVHMYEALNKRARDENVHFSEIIRRALAKELGLTPSESNTRTVSPFSEYEDSLIFRYYKSHGPSYLSEKLGRSPGSVAGRALVLGVRETKRQKRARQKQSRV